MVMVEPPFLALTPAPSRTASAAELTLPASAAADWASAGAATPSWNRTAALAAVEASNALRTRMAFPSALELVEFGRVAGRAGKTVTFSASLDPWAPCFKAVQEGLRRVLARQCSCFSRTQCSANLLRTAARRSP